MDGALKKEGQKSGTVTEEHITIKVQGQDGASVSFKIKKHTQFKKLFHAYCGKTNISQHLVRFRFDGDPVTETDTPLSMGMEEGDAIEVFQEQSGGSTCPASTLSSSSLAPHLHVRKSDSEPIRVMV